MNTLGKRLAYLRTAEAMLAFGLPAALVLFWRGYGDDFAWHMALPPLLLVAAILLQGALYWHLKLQSVQGRVPLPRWFGGVFRGFRAANVACAVALLAWLFVGFARGAAVSDTAWSMAVLAFAVIEHINYYVRQLMHDTAADWQYLQRNKRLRQPALAVDLARAA